MLSWFAGCYCCLQPVCSRRRKNDGNGLLSGSSSHSLHLIRTLCFGFGRIAVSNSCVLTTVRGDHLFSHASPASILEIAVLFLMLLAESGLPRT